MHGWGVLRSASEEPSQKLLEALSDPGAAQTHLLMSILERNTETRFGVSHDFSRIRSIADYRSAVPVRSYDGFSDDIALIAQGENNVLTRDPVIAFEQTGGTSSGGKLVPYTARSLASFRAAVLPWLGDLALHYPDVAKGTAYVSISPATRIPQTTPSGIPVGLNSDADYLGDDLVMPFASLLAVSPYIGAIQNIEEWRLSTLVQLIEHEDLAFVSIWSPTFMLQLLDAIPTLVPELTSRLTVEANRRLEQSLAQPAIDTRLLWPRLAVVSCWADAGSARFSNRLAALCPQAVLQAKGLLATEAAMTVPLARHGGCVAALKSCFIEFRDSAGEFWLTGELALGEMYDVILTTEGGLYRYDIGDRVQCVSKKGTIEHLKFIGRAGSFSDLVGEKLDEAFVAGILGELSLHAVLVAKTEPHPHYELLVDSSVSPPEAHLVEAALCRNPQYSYARKLGQLGPLQLNLAPGFLAAEAELRARNGQRLGDVKPSVLRVLPR